LKTREKIEVYAAHGGAWNHLQGELLKEGFSESFANAFISRFSQNLGRLNAVEAVEVYDEWINCNQKIECETFLRLKYF